MVVRLGIVKVKLLGANGSHDSIENAKLFPKVNKQTKNKKTKSQQTCPAVSVPIMTQRGPSPVRQSLTNPISCEIKEISSMKQKKLQSIKNHLCNVDETRSCASGSSCSLLVDLGQQSVGRMRHNRRNHSGNNSGRQRDSQIRALSKTIRI